MLPNGDVLVAEQSAGYLTLLREEGDGTATWITRHVEDLHRPYGLAWRNDHVLVADQDAIWRVPHTLGAVRAGRPTPPQRAEQVPPEDRKPSPGAYGAALLTQKGVFGVPTGHQNRPLAVDPKTGALFVGVGSSGNLGVEPEPKATIQRFDADGGQPDRPTRRGCATRRASPFTRRRATSGPSCRSGTGSATICPPTT